MDWLSIGKWLLTQGVLGFACLVQAIVIKTLWDALREKDEELIDALEDRGAWLERELTSRLSRPRSRSVDDQLR